MARNAKCVASALVLALGLWPASALAWKPYTHSYTGKQVLRDLDCASGRISFEGASYRVLPQVAAAICAHREAYQAGVIGPDGFPDLTYGQAVVHPANTGRWLAYLLAAAWAAQSSPTYPPADKERILAFTYGFLTHAAGDLWGHTFVNEFANGVFPSVQEVVADPAQNLPLAVRHIIVEGVVGDATPGFDGNPAERKSAPGGYGMTGGDRSTDATEGYRYDVPHAFLFATLVSPEAATPVFAQRGHYVEARGPLIGEFLELRDQLREFARDAGPVEQAAAEYDDRMNLLRSIQQTCVSSCLLGLFKNFRRCADELAKLELTLGDLSRKGLDALIDQERDRLANRVLRAYLKKWADNIDAGLRQWTHFGLATTQALFDAQTHREEQNEYCQELSIPEDAANEDLRKICEEHVAIRETVKRRSRDFIEHHGLKMLGLPEESVHVYEILQQQEQRLLEMLAAIASPLRPLAEDAVRLKARFDDLMNQAISDVLGVDIDALESMLRGPAAWMCARETEITVRGAKVKVALFEDGDRAKLDAYLGLDAASHTTAPGVPAGCGRLKDDAEFTPDAVPAIRNTILMGKLLLLEPAEVNRLLGVALGGGGLPGIATYGSGDNVMTTGFDVSEPWLRLIDGDHAWRSDGRPVFGPRLAEKTGGTGRFPIWESCVLRTAFRNLFRDWENPPGAPFLAHGDAASPDPANSGRICIETSVAVPIHLAPAAVPPPSPRRVPGRMLSSDAAPDPRVLRKYDANKNGVLDPEELAQLRTALTKER
jgi:hypothetical protein